MLWYFWIASLSNQVGTHQLATPTWVQTRRMQQQRLQSNKTSNNCSEEASKQDINEAARFEQKAQFS
jgi:hypothetical protein